MISGAKPTRVLRTEHLAVIAQQTGRGKDRHSVRLLLEQAAIDDRNLSDMLMRHGLEASWRQCTAEAAAAAKC